MSPEAPRDENDQPPTIPGDGGAESGDGAGVDVVASEPEPSGPSVSEEAERRLLAMMPRIHVESTWAAIRTNPLFRRGVSFRRIGRIFDHPIVTPILLGLAIAASFEPAKHAVERWLVSSGRSGYLLFGVYVVAFCAYLAAMGYQRLRCQARMLELRDNGSLQELLSSGFSFDEVVLGLVFPYEIGDRLGIVAIMCFFFYESDDAFWRIVIALFALNMLWGMAREGPITTALQLQQYFSTRRLGGVWGVMLMAGVPLATWFALMAGFFFYLIPYLATRGFNVQESIIVVFIATMFVHRALERRWMIWRLKRFIRRYGGIGALMEEFLRGGR
jgi:hypothetical protein